jgi:Mrp family chromosome partitioning ATPase
MQFILKEATAPVILVTSAMPADGKTFSAICLASVYSMLGKKTFLSGLI